MNQHIPEVVVIHPLVLLSVVDHYNRVVAKVKGKRVVGVLLGIINSNSTWPFIIFDQANGIKEP